MTSVPSHIAPSGGYRRPKPCKTFSEIMRRTGLTPGELFYVCVGNPATWDVANLLAEHVGMTAHALMQPTRQFRRGTLELIATDLGISKSTLWRVLRGKAHFGYAIAIKAFHLTGIPTEAWMVDTAGTNWMIAETRRLRSIRPSGRGRKNWKKGDHIETNPDPTKGDRES